MSDRRGPDPLTDTGVLADFHAQVEHLTSLTPEVFAALDPDALEPLVTTIRAISSEGSTS